ncbi:MAG: rhomboid family intramembrane serine protease [Ignavibacteriaceae bacterium]
MSNYYRPGGFGGFSFFPPVIKNLLIINGVVFLLQIIMENLTYGGYPGSYIVHKWFALNPIGGMDPAGMPFNFQVWQLITYQFMHGSFGHIFFNMFALWMFGMEIENLWGSKKFLYFYLLCGIVAGIVQLLISPLFGGGYAYTVGASGSIFGVFIAFAMMFPNRYIFLYFFIPIKAKYLIGILIVMQFMFFGGNSNIAFLAHLGGALAGFLFILLDKNSNTEIKNMFTRRSAGSSKPFNPFGAMGEKFKRKEVRKDVEEARFYEVNDDEDKITQKQIDEILDKISQSGYQNLTEKEKKILFEASRKMK